MLHSAGFKREQSRQRSTRITQTKCTTGKEKKAWHMQTEVGERERERVLALGPGGAGVCFVVCLGSCDSRFRHFRHVCGLFPPAGFVQIFCIYCCCY